MWLDYFVNFVKQIKFRHLIDESHFIPLILVFDNKCGPSFFALKIIKSFDSHSLLLGHVHQRILVLIFIKGIQPVIIMSAVKWTRDNENDSTSLYFFVLY